MAYGSKQLDAALLRRGWLRAVAIGLLASLATFFAVHALWKPGVGRSLVQAALQYEPGEPASPLNLDEVRAQVTSAAALQEALRTCGQSGDSANVAAWQSQLSVYRTHSRIAGGADRVLIELPTFDQASAIPVVQALTQRYLKVTTDGGGLQNAAVKELAAARRAAADALVKEDIARRELDNAVKEQFEQLKEAKSTVAQNSKLTTVDDAENPAWTEQSQKITALEKKRDDLLLTLTTAHPKVRDIDSELEELQSRQDSTPRYLDGREAEEPPMPELQHAADPMLAESQQRITAAQDAYATARATRLEAQAAVEVLERSTAEAPGKAPRFVLAQSAQTVQQDPAVSPLMRYTALLLLSTLVLLATTYALRPRMRPQLLSTVEDVANLLRLPVVGKLKLNGSHQV